jgi:hypothetical protein
MVEKSVKCAPLSQGVSGMKGFGIHFGSTLCFGSCMQFSVPSMSCVSVSDRHTGSTSTVSSNPNSFPFTSVALYVSRALS